MVIAVLWERIANPIQWPFKLPALVTTGISMFVTFNLVTFAWIFFRANSLADASYIVSHLFTNLSFRPSLYGTMPGGAYEFAIAVAAILLMELVHWIQMTNGSARRFIYRQPVWLRWPAYYALVLVIIMFGQFGLIQFIYFQF
jgi:D-alanyl-lipoteichoic acid acyltransferase DltB (MBOAT superfamily)